MSDEPARVLEIKGLSGRYGKVPILHGIDLQVTEDEAVATTDLSIVRGFVTDCSLI